MKISSTFLPQTYWDEVGGLETLSAFEVQVDNKTLVVGITVGKMVGPALDDAEVSPLAMRVVSRVIDYHQLNHLEGAPFVVAEIKGTLAAVKRVREVFRLAPHRSGLMLMCSSESVYKAAFSALCVDFNCVTLSNGR